MPRYYTRRFSIEITDEQAAGLSILEHGMKKQIFQLLIDDFLYLCNKHSPGVIIGALLSRSIGIKELSKLNLKEKP